MRESNAPADGGSRQRLSLRGGTRTAEGASDDIRDSSNADAGSGNIDFEVIDAQVENVKAVVSIVLGTSVEDAEDSDGNSVFSRSMQRAATFAEQFRVLRSNALALDTQADGDEEQPSGDTDPSGNTDPSVDPDPSDSPTESVVPTVSVTLSDDPAPAATDGGIRYYNTEIEAIVKIVAEDFGSGTVTVSIGGKEQKEIDFVEIEDEAHSHVARVTLDENNAGSPTGTIVTARYTPSTPADEAGGESAGDPTGEPSSDPTGEPGSDPADEPSDDPSPAPASNAPVEAMSEKVVIDKTAPTINVTWEDADGQPVEAGGASYYTDKRTATITITEQNFDSGLVVVRKGADVVPSSELVWKHEGDEHAATCVFDGTVDGASLAVEAPDKATNKLEGGSVSDGTYASDTFNMFVNPRLTVTYSPDAENIELAPDKYFNVSGSGGKVTATITVADPAFVAGNITVRKVAKDAKDDAIVEDAAVESGEDAWTDSQSVLFGHEMKVEFEGENVLHSLVVETSDVDRPFSGDGHVSGDDNIGIKYENVDFILDKTPPTASVSFESGGTSATVGDVLYFSDAATTEITVVDDRPGTKMQATVVKDGVTDSPIELEFAPDEEVANKYVTTATLDAVENGIATYTLTVSGADALGIPFEPIEKTVVIRRMAPEVSLSFASAEGGAAGRLDSASTPTHYFTGAVTAIATVTDPLFDAEKVSITVGEKPVDELTWNADNDDTMRRTATFRISEANKNLPVALTAIGLGGEERAGTVTENVVIDTVDPVLSVAYDQQPQSFDAAQAAAVAYTPETRYYAANVAQPLKVTIKVADAFLPTSGGTLVARVGATSVGLTAENNYTAVVDISRASSLDTAVSVTGTDYAGNSLSCASTDTVTAGGMHAAPEIEAATGNMRYDSRITVDAEKPGISKVSYVKGQAATPVALAQGGVVNSKEGLAFSATVQDEHFIEQGKEANSSTTVRLVSGSGEGARVIEPDFAWRPASGTSHSLEFFVRNTVEGTYTLEIAVKDRVGNAADPFTATVVIDTTAPKLTVDYGVEAAKVIPGSSLENPEVRYYGIAQGIPITPRLTIVDANVIEDGIAATVNDTALTFAKDPSSGNWVGQMAGGITGEGAYQVIATVIDTAGNQLVVDGGSAIFSDATVNGGKYSSTVIVDQTRPTIDATYQRQGESSAELVHQSPTVYSNVVTTVEATVTELNFDAELMSFDVSPDVAGDGWRGSGANGHVSSYVLDTSANTETTYELSARGTDLALNNLDAALDDNPDATVYTATVKIDKISPTMSVSFVTGSGVRESVEQAAQSDEVRYYDGSVRARITVKDTSMGDGILVDGKPVPRSSWTVSGSTYTYEVPYNREGEYELTVSGVDLARNEIVSGDASTLVSNGRYETRVVVDKTNPALKVTWGDASSNDKYYKANRSARIVVTEQHFDPTRIFVDGAVTAARDWEVSGNRWTYIRPLDYTEDGTYSLKVEGTDRAGRPLTGDDDCTPQNTTDGDGVYDSGDFVIDKVAPAVVLRFGQPRVRTIDKVDYFAKKELLPVAVEVTDENFDPAADRDGATLVTPKGSFSASYSKDLWKDGSYTVTFNENTLANRASDLSVIIYDLAGNTTTYRYGDIGAKLSTKESVAGKATTVDSNGAALRGSAFALDVTAPEVEAANAKTGDIPNRQYSSDRDRYESAFIFFNSETQFKIRVNDNVGIHVLELAKDKFAPESPYTFSNDESKQGGTSRTVTVTLRDGAEFTGSLYLYSEDNALNKRIWRINPRRGTVVDVTGSLDINAPLYGSERNLYPRGAIQDTVDPELGFSGVNAGMYYNEPMTVRLNVSELNFHYLQSYEGDKQVVAAAMRDGNAGLAETRWEPMPIKSFSETPYGEPGVDYFNEITLGSDGHYSFVADLTDPAGNTASTARTGEFTIDRTAPTVRVTFDNNNVTNGRYYSAFRTATIVITEHNFSPDLINVSTTGSIGGWANDGDTHTIIVSFGSDGVHNLSVSGRDLANNALETYTTDEFTIDTKAPTISLVYMGSDNENQRAFNGKVQPVITFADEANYNSNGASFTITGNKVGNVAEARGAAYGYLRAENGLGETVTYADFERAIQVDDIYTVTATLTDMAGNEAVPLTDTFSVNRFGSNYTIVRPTPDSKGSSDLGYLASAPEIVIQEVNVMGIQESSVAVTYNLKTNALPLKTEPGQAGYTVRDLSAEANFGWQKYEYTIAKESFMGGSGGESPDGNYVVVLSSKDATGNMNSSASFWVAQSDAREGLDAANPNAAEEGVSASVEREKRMSAAVKFTLDTTPPNILGLSVSNGETVQAAGGKEVSFIAADNLGLDESRGITVRVNNETVEHHPSGDGSGRVTFAVPEKPFVSQPIEISVTDFARNEKSLGSGDGSGGTFEIKVTNDFFDLYLPFVVAGGVGIAVIVAAVALGIIRARRRKNAETSKAVGV